MDYLWAAEAAAERETGGYWQLALILAAIGFLGLFARWRKARQPPPVVLEELRERDKHPNRYRDNADRALVELVEMGREINAQVDNKIRFLNRLVKDADDRIARLENLLKEAEAAPRGGPPPGLAVAPGADQDSPPPAPAPSTSRRFRSELQARVVQLAEGGKSTSEIAKATGLSILEIQLALKNAEGGAPGGER